jgi:hypothetical protein
MAANGIPSRKYSQLRRGFLQPFQMGWGEECQRTLETTKRPKYVPNIHTCLCFLLQVLVWNNDADYAWSVYFHSWNSAPVQHNQFISSYHLTMFTTNNEGIKKVKYFISIFQVYSSLKQRNLFLLYFKPIRWDTIEYVISNIGLHQRIC